MHVNRVRVHPIKEPTIPILLRSRRIDQSAIVKVKQYKTMCGRFIHDTRRSYLAPLVSIGFHTFHAHFSSGPATVEGAGWRGRGGFEEDPATRSSIDLTIINKMNEIVARKGVERSDRSPNVEASVV